MDLQAIDVWLFYLGNHSLSNPVFDVFFTFITDIKIFRWIYAAFLLALLWKGGRNGRLCVLIIVLTITVSDQLSSKVIKEGVGRIRPCHTLENVNLLVNCGSGKSFPSSHAVNNFAAALIFGFFFRSYMAYFLTFAALVAYSRVYCGVHYPFDIAAGALIGLTVAALILGVWQVAFRAFKPLALPYSPRALLRSDRRKPAT